MSSEKFYFRSVSYHGVGPAECAEAFAQLCRVVPGVAPDRFGAHEPLRLRFDAATFADDYMRECLMGAVTMRKKPRITGALHVCPPPRRTEFLNCVTMEGELPEHCEQRLLELALAASNLFRADLTAVHIVNSAEANYLHHRGWTTVRDYQHAELALGLPDLPWLTVWGPMYIRHFGRERVLAVPSPIVQDVGRDRVLVQLCSGCRDIDDQWNRFDHSRQIVMDNLGRDSFVGATRQDGRHSRRSAAVVPEELVPIREYLFECEQRSGRAREPDVGKRPEATVDASRRGGMVLDKPDLAAKNGSHMKYDDASWHYGGDFPKDLPMEAAGTHSGMFLAWALLSGLGDEEHWRESPEVLEQLQSRQITPGRLLMEYCDEKFLSVYLGKEGNAFATEYFDFEKGSYLIDYAESLASDLPTLYHVSDSWANFDRLKPIIDGKHAQWRKRVAKK